MKSNRPSWDSPISMFVLAAMWSSLETLAFLLLAEPWEQASLLEWIYGSGRPGGITSPEFLNQGGVVAGSVVGFCLLVVTWAIWGDPRGRHLTPQTRRHYCVHLLATLALVIVQISLLIWIFDAPILLGMGLIGLTLTAALLVLHRQLYGVQISRDNPSPPSYYSIRGLMALTAVAAVMLSIASRSLELDGTAFRLALIGGAVYAVTWWWMLGFALKRNFLWLVFSIFGLIGFVLSLNVTGALDATFDPSQIEAANYFAVSLFLHGIGFLAIGVTDGHRLTNTRFGHSAERWSHTTEESLLSQ